MLLSVRGVGVFSGVLINQFRERGREEEEEEEEGREGMNEGRKEGGRERRKEGSEKWKAEQEDLICSVSDLYVLITPHCGYFQATNNFLNI